jgi:signal peptidase I
MSDEATEKGDIFSTWRRAVFDPKALYAAGGPEPRRTHPLVFAIVVATFAQVAVALAAGGFAAALGVAIATPLLTIVSLYVSAALVHFWLIVLRARGEGFRATVAATAYADAPIVLGIIPVVGAVLGYLGYLVVLARGLRYAQRTAPWKAWVAALLGAGTPVLLALGTRAGVVEAFNTPSGSMAPTLLMGDHLFVEKLSYGPLIPGTRARLYSGLPPRRGDTMVFKFPENELQDFVKRAIALPGDTLEAVNGRPVINGFLAPHCRVGAFQYEARTLVSFVEFLGDRDYLTLFETDPDAEPCGSDGTCADSSLTCRSGVCGTVQGPFVVGADEVWVMGDNRNNSHDSRSWRNGLGAGVPFANIKGRATFLWMSFGTGGSIRTDRIGMSLTGKPALSGQNAALAAPLAECLRNRPPVAQTTPPAGRR